MTKEKYIDDLKDIKSMMERSSRFISLSGLSGVVAGIWALVGAYLAYQTVYANQDYLNYRNTLLDQETILRLVGIAIGLLIVTILSALFFTQRKARKNKQKLWDKHAKLMIINLMIPLTIGGIFCLILLFKGFIGLLAPLTLVFYGLALINASKYTLSEIRSLGIIEAVIGLIGCQFIGYGLVLWVLGFGIMHIIYGIIMYVKYES